MKTAKHAGKKPQRQKAHRLITMKTTPRVLTLTRLIAAALSETQYAVLERLTEKEWQRVKSLVGY